MHTMATYPSPVAYAPLGVILGLQLILDGGKPITLLYQRCSARRCNASECSTARGRDIRA